MARNETKHMEAVIALAEELNFTLAAQKLHVSQPTVTRTIAEIESSVGSPLFDRDRKTVRLNAAGRAYLGPARVALLEAERAIGAARTVAQNFEAALHIGKSPYIDPFFVSTLLTLRLSRFPRLRIEFSSQFSFDLAHDLLSGTLDLALANEPPDSPFLTKVKLGEAPFYVAASEEDELAQNLAVRLECLDGRHWIAPERRLHPPLYDRFMDFAEKRDVKPRSIHHIIDPEEALPFVTDLHYIAVVLKPGALRICRNGIAIRLLAEPSPLIGTYLMSRADNASPVASAVVRGFMAQLSEVRSKDDPLLYSSPEGTGDVQST